MPPSSSLRHGQGGHGAAESALYHLDGRVLQHVQGVADDSMESVDEAIGKSYTGDAAGGMVSQGGRQRGDESAAAARG
jgi:hypothetical protein